MNEEIEEKKQNTSIVDLKNGQIIFASWKNKDQNKSYYKALNDKDIIGIRDKDSKEKAILKKTQEWLLAYSVHNGSGFLKGTTIIETFDNIQDMDIVEATNLGSAFNTFANDMVESIKKK